MKTILVFFIIIAIGDCLESNLQHLPDPKNEETDHDRICDSLNITINFSDLNLNTIKEHFLSSPIITCLDLSSNGIESVDSNAFVNLPNLKYLNLDNNRFGLYDIFLYGHMNLETLILDNSHYNTHNNYYSKESCNSYSCFIWYDIKVQTVYPKLKKLFMRNSSKRLKLTAASKMNFPSLSHLYLSGSTIMHDEFNWLPNTLEYLDLSGHDLETLTLNDLRNLKWIFLDNPVRKSLHKIYFKNLVSLKYLSVPSNKIDEITSATFANVNSLLFLDLSDNDIRYIEGGSFDSMKNLESLDLSKNNIEVIQGGTFDKLGNLQVLSLEKNLISMFPMIANEIKLKVLLLNCNKLKSIVGGTFVKMPYLESLYLHDNELSYIDQEAFAGLKNLKTLTISNNKLSSLPTNWMLPLMNLENLDLTANNIKEFGHLSLSDSSPIQNLYLSNQLQYLRSNSLDNIPENVTISLKDDYVFVEKCVKDDEKYSRNRYG